MRPSDAFGCPRPADNDGPPAFHSSNNSPQNMTYFLADEASVDAFLEQPLPSPHRSRDARKQQSAKPETSTPLEAEIPDMPSTGLPAEMEKSPQGVESRPETPSYRPSGTPASHPLPSISQPMTPIMLGTPGPASALSSSSSRRNSFAGSFSEDIESGALSIAGDSHPEQSSSMMDSGSAPQLVMPSIKMPSRRPFTEGGKRRGRRTVLVAGDSGMLLPHSMAVSAG